jgi:hypothetical protein
VIGAVEPHPPWRHGRKSTASALGLVSIDQLVFDGGLQDRGQRREHHVDRSRPQLALLDERQAVAVDLEWGDLIQAHTAEVGQ